MLEKSYARSLKDSKGSRIEIIDALRGISVILMVIHHLLFNVWQFLDGPRWLFTNPVFDVLQVIFAGLFIFLSGVSSRFSRDNIKRGAIVAVFAMIITYVTVRVIDMPIWFGILHLLGFSMLFYGLTHKLWNFIPKFIAPFAYIAAIVFSVIALNTAELTSETVWMRDGLWILGWRQPGYISRDYFPILPWIFVFLLGTWAGWFIAEKKLPAGFYRVKPSFFSAVGRKALVIYVLHQPILYGAAMLILRFRNA